MLSLGDSPVATKVEPKWHDRILHVTLHVDGLELAGADVLPQDYAAPQGFSILLSFEDSVQGERVFNDLAVGGEVRFPFQPTFWSSGFGVLVDESVYRAGLAVRNLSLPPDREMEPTVKSVIRFAKRRAKGLPPLPAAHLIR